MSLKEKLREDMKEAMKAKDALRLSTVRLLISAIKNKEIELIREMGDDEVISVLSTAAKQRRESVEQYEKAGRLELAEQEKAELAIIISYMPVQLSKEDVTAIVRETASEVGAEGPKDMGKLMKALMPKVKGKADGKLVNEVVKEALGN